MLGFIIPLWSNSRWWSR